MPEQFENTETTKLAGETTANAAAEKRIELVAEQAAQKFTKTEQRYDRNRGIFSK